MKLSDVSDGVTLTQVIDYLKYQESFGLSLAQCITKLEQEELPKVVRPKTQV